MIRVPEHIRNFLSTRDYDLRKSGYGRWFDQKCTPDVVSFVADCVVMYYEQRGNKLFTIKDIWFSDYAKENAMGSFRKPNPETPTSQHEYDKFFGQPLLLLAYAGVLQLRKTGNKNYFYVNNFDMLQYIAMRDRNAIDFMYGYIEKVLKDSFQYRNFVRFFERQNAEEYFNLKRSFEIFLHTYTPIKKHLECGRIFSKVLNILAYGNEKKGTQAGHISANKIELSDLMYNSDNFRDIYANKPKGLTRAEYRETLNITSDSTYNNAFSTYQIARAKRYVRDYNAKYCDSYSEIFKYDMQDSAEATYIHHIFPKSGFPEIAHFMENLIALTPNQHWNKAHPHGNTQIIDKSFQQILIICKCDTIRTDYIEKRGIYDFNKLLVVLNTGLDTEVFDEIDYLDFDEVIKQVNRIYTEIQ